MAHFPDHFSSVAGTYAQFRPSYPPSLFDWIAAHAPPDAVVWDCAAGSGQATIPLAERFAHVTATDASATQVSHAPLHPRVTWRVAPAEDSGLDTHSVDIVTIAQALHWFDLERFWPEVRRVVRPGGLVVAWTYGNHRVDDPALDQVMEHFSNVVVGSWWPPNREHINARYTTLTFPFERLDAPSMDLTVTWTLDQLLGYIRSWSAVSAHAAERRGDPVAALDAALRPLWGSGARTVRWPMTVLAGRTMTAPT